MPRLLFLVLALSLAAVACTTSQAGPAVTTTSTASPAPATTEPSSETTTTTTTTTIDAPADPGLPDPVEIAEQGWGEITGFSSIDVLESEMDEIDLRLRSIIGTAIEGVSYTGLQTEDGGSTVIGLSMSPAVSLSGDPFLAPGLAGAIAGPFAGLEEVPIEGTLAYRVFVGGNWWYLWASNTHLYATVGAEVPAERAMESTIRGAPLPYLWQAGDCLWFGTGEDTAMPYAPYGKARLVPCSGAHTHEVIFSTTTQYGLEDDFPGEAFSTEVERSCGSAYRDYVGVDWPDSRVSAIRYLPDSAEWDEGDRYTACVVELSDQLGGATRITGTLEGIGAASLIDRTPGDCYVNSLNSDPVDCRLTHTFQFIGRAEDPTPAGTPYPGATALFESQLPVCAALVDEFAPTLTANGARVSVHATPPSVLEWEDDLRTIRCFAFATDIDGGRLEISGSFDGEWEIVRFSEDDVTAKAPGPGSAAGS